MRSGKSYIIGSSELYPFCNPRNQGCYTNNHYVVKQSCKQYVTHIIDLILVQWEHKHKTIIVYNRYNNNDSNGYNNNNNNGYNNNIIKIIIIMMIIIIIMVIIIIII